MSESEFTRLARSIDEAERLADDRIGGPTDAQCAAIRRLEAALPAPSCVLEWRWLAGRFVRAFENEWRPEAVDRLAELAGVR